MCEIMVIANWFVITVFAGRPIDSWLKEKFIDIVKRQNLAVSLVVAWIGLTAAVFEYAGPSICR